MAKMSFNEGRGFEFSQVIEGRTLFGSCAV